MATTAELFEAILKAEAERDALAAENAKLREALVSAERIADDETAKWWRQMMDADRDGDIEAAQKFEAIRDCASRITKGIRAIEIPSPPAALQELRDGVIEECAKVADATQVLQCMSLAYKLRAMKGKTDD